MDFMGARGKWPGKKQQATQPPPPQPGLHPLIRPPLLKYLQLSPYSLKPTILPQPPTQPVEKDVKPIPVPQPKQKKQDKPQPKEARTPPLARRRRSTSLQSTPSPPPSPPVPIEPLPMKPSMACPHCPHCLRKMPCLASCPNSFNNNACLCYRPPAHLRCTICHNEFSGRIKRLCPQHPRDEFLMDYRCCPSCKASYLEMMEF